MTTPSSYVPVSALLDPRCRVAAPTMLDWLPVSYCGIVINVMGVLHARTGGTNAAYREFINRSLARRRARCTLGEQRLKRFYPAIDFEVADWRQVPPRDLFRMMLL